VTTPPELECLRSLAMADPRQEAAYLRALLSAKLYAHKPLSNDSNKLHLLMFTRADGVTVIPMFTDLEKADAAAGGSAGVVAAPGLELFEATRGATLMLDPNDIGMTLYPEEVAALLDEGHAGRAPIAAEAPDLVLAPLSPRNVWVFDLVARAVTTIPGVGRSHLASAHPRGGPATADRLLAIVAAPDSVIERVARAIAVALEGAPRVPWLPVDLAAYPPGGPLPPEVAEGLAHALTREIAVPGRDPCG